MHLSAYSFVFLNTYNKELYLYFFSNFNRCEVIVNWEKPTHIFKKCSDSLNLKVIPLFLKFFLGLFFTPLVSLHVDTGSLGFSF